MQTEAGGIAQVVGMAREFAAGGKLVCVLGDNIFEFAQSDDIADWSRASDDAQIFVKNVPDPENFGVVAYDDNGTAVDIVEKAGVVDQRYESPPSKDAVVGLYCYPPDVFDVIAGLEPSTRGELEITDVNRHYARVRTPRDPRSRRVVGGRRQALAAPRRHRPAHRATPA